jgi:hypothetical protein
VKKREMLEKYSELANNRDMIASASVTRLLSIANDPAINATERAYVHQYIVDATTEDQKLDQMEVANLIAVANSAAFSDDTRATAVDRVIIMLELEL